MNRNRSSYRWIRLVAASVLAFTLVGCGGGSGSGASPAGASGAAAGVDASVAALTGATTLNIGITGVSINSAPVVNFTVTNQNGIALAGLSATDLLFNIAKLVPPSNGEPSVWQNYINTASSGGVQGSQERLAAGFAFGTLVNHGDGRYTYTFATDITNLAANPCPAPCTSADGKPLNIGYQPNATHRVTIQQANSAYPKSTGVHDFVPGGGAITQRDIVLTSTCNQCHGEVTMRGTTRVDVRLCVTCHNPGSWLGGTPNTSLDLKVQSHRIHYKIFNSVNSTNPSLPNFLPSVLPSVFAGTPYKIGNTDFSVPTFAQDVRNCTKCHDGALSAQGDNWKTQPSIAACGACHDNVNFGALADAAKPKPHSGGVVSDNSTCVLCHGAGKVADVVVAHNFPARLKAAAAKFKFNIINATPTAPGSFPVITFSVTDPSNADKPYDIKTDAPFTAGANSTLTVKLGWSQSGIADIGNDGSGQAFGQPVSINLLGNAAVVPGASAGTYTVTSTLAIPAAQTGTLRVMMDGHPAGDVTTAGTFIDRLAVKSVFKDFAITGSVTARRVVVDIAKCNVCHSVLSMPGNNRTGEPGVCAVCHNPNATDASQRPATAGVLSGGADGKLEESIDWKIMSHAIHAGEAGKGGIRTKGITIYGSGGSVKDFSKVVLHRKLSDCTICHAGTSYQLTGIWASPTANGILGSTVSTAASTSDASDNLRISPIAAVCSSCHDSAQAKLHMQDAFNGANFSATQVTLNTTVVENCAFCHGAGRVFDVKVVHGVK